MCFFKVPKILPEWKKNRNVKEIEALSRSKRVNKINSEHEM